MFTLRSRVYSNPAQTVAFVGTVHTHSSANGTTSQPHARKISQRQERLSRVSGDIFAAQDPALGYAYQTLYALFASLQRLKASATSDDPDFDIALEVLDDVSFSRGGEALAALQLKHHKKGAANLSDASPDLWKTIRIWSCALAEDRVGTQTVLLLLTTSAVGPRSAAALLCADPERRDVAKAVKNLVATAQSSTSKENREGYDAFLGLSEELRKSLVDSIRVIDGAPAIGDLRGLLLQEIALAARSAHRPQLLNRVIGWWVQRVLDHLLEPTKIILSQELQATMDDLREQFSQHNLPIDDDLIDDAFNAEDFMGRVFVAQLSLVRAGEKRVLQAIRDYYRAFTQRSRWIREDLVEVGELGKYERHLKDEWERLFAEMQENCDADATEAMKVNAARALYRWVSQEANFPIRERCLEPFVTRGSYQILADDCRVGWHVEFESRLAAILGSKH